MCTGGRILFAAALAASGISGAWFGVASARAENCPGNPNALGTSRTIVVDPAEYQRIGIAQYKQTLPLADHEVVLTFDDGPLPPYSNEVLDTLISQCVKATFFIVGEMARAYPDVLRREYEAGYTIGTHSQNHPRRFETLTGDRLNQQIDGGIASVSAALGDPAAVAPFFRIPGLGRSEVIEKALADRGLAVFSIDTDADDWFRHVSAAQVVEKAMSRLEKLHGGILLLHDIHPWTAQGLPELLRRLKEHGFHIVNIVPSAAATANAVKPPTVASAEPSLPASVAQQSAPGLQDLGASLHRRSLAGVEPRQRPSVDGPATSWHERLRHARLHGHHRAWRHAHVDYEGEYSF
jgi:peptidoglycan/xylan/chitin deacetylase (PgdA/CDA1 family)